MTDNRALGLAWLYLAAPNRSLLAEAWAMVKNGQIPEVAVLRLLPWDTVALAIRDGMARPRNNHRR